LHAYTEALLAAVPIPNPELKHQEAAAAGRCAEPDQSAAGLHLHTHCPYAEPRCRIHVPALLEISPGHMVACYLR
jgi:oligopeptide transport system ATP-binding protein